MLARQHFAVNGRPLDARCSAQATRLGPDALAPGSEPRYHDRLVLHRQSLVIGSRARTVGRRLATGALCHVNRCASSII
jgi:hypothetical protein